MTNILYSFPLPPDNKNLLDSLRWDVVFYFIDRQDTLYVKSDPFKKEHFITLPTRSIRWLEIQHELAHCFLAERKHPLFSGTVFKRGTSQELINAFIPVWQCATDWFVDDIIYKMWPRAGLDEIQEHILLMLKISPQLFNSSQLIRWSIVLFYIVV